MHGEKDPEEVSVLLAPLRLGGWLVGWLFAVVVAGLLQYFAVTSLLQVRQLGAPSDAEP